MIANPSTELADLQERVGKGIEWLTEHDPSGAFHLWWESGLTPLSPMPAQDAGRRVEWQAYHAARTLWERLWKKMLTLEKKEASR